MHFLLAFLFISVRIALAIEGSFDPVHETVCEFQDASLTWPNTTTNSAHNVKSRIWYKGNTTLMASWRKEYGFDIFPPYIGRVMQIGESGVKIKEAKRSDSGTYLLIWKIENAKNTSASVTNLQVIVPPTTQCIPNITREGNSLRAILPLEGCGIPRLTPNWTSGTQELISDRISVLDLKLGPKPEVYIACAVGYSKRCIQVDSSNLCINYTEPQPQTESDTGLILWWIPVLIITIIIIIITVAVLLYQKKLFVSTDTGQTVEETNLETPLMNIHTTGTITSQTDDEANVEVHLIHPPTADIIKLQDDLIQAYRTLRCVQVSPTFEDLRRDIDNIYVDLVIGKKQDGRNTEKERECKDPQVIKSYKEIFLRDTDSKFKRVFLRGKGGLGKTTFCRKVLHAWCNAHKVRAVAQDGPFQDETVLQMFHLLFYLNLREITVKEKTLIDVICKQFPLKEVPSESILGTLLERNEDKVLFILDGLDEMIVEAEFIEKVCKSSLYPNHCFLVSSRPWKICQMELYEGSEIDLLLDLQGFSKQNAIKCAEKLFENYYKDGNAIKQFTKDIMNNMLATSLIHVPLLLLFLAHVWYKKERSLPSKLHELYISFLDLMADRMTEKYKKDPTDKQKRFSLVHTQSLLPSKISETSLVVNFGEGFLLSLCEVAHDFLLSKEKENSLVFEKTKLLKALGNRGKEKLDVALHLGILSVVRESMSPLVEDNIVSFLHKTMQEFFTALYFIFKPDKLANFISSMANLNYVFDNENIIIFLVGLMPKFGKSVLAKVNELNSDRILKTGMEQSIHEFAIHYTKLDHVNTVYLRCKEEVIKEDREDVLLNVSHLCIGIYGIDLFAWRPCDPMLSPQWEANVLDLREFLGLTYLILRNSLCELYLPESGSLSVICMERVRMSSSYWDLFGSTLIHCNKMERLRIHEANLHNCLLDLSNMTELRILDMDRVTLSSSCCDILGSTLTHCTKLETLEIHKTNLHNCLLDLSNMTELRILDMDGVTLSSSCCDVLGRTLTHCTKLGTLKIQKTDLHNCLLDLSNVTELRILDMDRVTLSSSCCDILGSTLTHCTKLETLEIHKTDLHNCLFDFSNMTELGILYMGGVTLSSSCCDVLGRTLTHCTKLETLKIQKTDLHSCLLDLSNVTQLRILDMDRVTLSSSCCDILGTTLTHCTKLETLDIRKTDLHNFLLDLSDMTELSYLMIVEVILSSSACQILELSFDKLKAVKKNFGKYTCEKSPCDNEKWKVNTKFCLDNA